METKKQSMAQNENQFELRDFAVLLVKKRFPDASPEIATEMENDVLDRVDSFINAALLDSLPEEDLPIFEEMLEKNDDIEIQMFLQDRIPDITKVTIEAMDRFAKVYVGDIN